MRKPKAYDGYLAPHLSRVHVLLGSGFNLRDVARGLYAEGVRPPYGGSAWNPRGYPSGMAIEAIYGGLRHALRLNKKPSPVREVPWIVWTPESQAIELAMERAPK